MDIIIIEAQKITVGSFNERMVISVFPVGVLKPECIDAVGIPVELQDLGTVLE